MLSVVGRNARLRLAADDGWNRQLLYDARPLCELGNVCGTCPFYFERVDVIPGGLAPAALRDALTHGLAEVHESHAETLAELLPVGDFNVALLTRTPRCEATFFTHTLPAAMAEEGLTGPPDASAHYECGDALLYEFLVPLVDDDALDPARIAWFEARLDAGESPTLLALSVLDVKFGFSCLAHYVLDGHHKLRAAARRQRPITVLSCFARDFGVAPRASQIAFYRS